MTDRVFVTYDGGMGNLGHSIMTLKQVEEFKKEVTENGDEEYFTFTYISNNEYLVLVKLGLAQNYEED